MMGLLPTKLTKKSELSKAFELFDPLFNIILAKGKHGLSDSLLLYIFVLY